MRQKKTRIHINGTITGMMMILKMTFHSSLGTLLVLVR